MNQREPRKWVDQKPGAAHTEGRARPKDGRRTGWFVVGGPMSRLIAVISNVAELGLFFAAAVALGAGLLSLR